MDLSSLDTREITLQSEPAPIVHTLFQQSTGKWQYIVADPASRHAVIIDPLLDSVMSSGSISTTAADEVLDIVRKNSYIVDRILETHHPTDHATSAWYLRTQIMEETGLAPRVNIEKSIAGVQRLFQRKYGISDCDTWAYDFDRSYNDGEILRVGRMRITILGSLGLHSSIRQTGFLINRIIFVGDMHAARDLPNKAIGLRDDPANYQVYASSGGERQ